MKRNRRLIFFSVAALVLMATAFFGNARKERSFTASPAKTLTMLVDSVDYRSELTRLYGRIIGRPHTSQRIDKIELQSNGMRLEANDIDGVDFQRWFQWEDEGVINLEIDFPPMQPIKSGRLFLITPRGTEEITITATPGK